MTNPWWAALAGAAMTVAAVAPGQAAELLCPASLKGAPLKAYGNSTLFNGDPAKNESLAPGTKMSGAKFTNTWSLSRGEAVTLVCEYVGGEKAVFQVPNDAKLCTQTGTRTAASSISCHYDAASSTPALAAVDDQTLVEPMTGGEGRYGATRYGMTLRLTMVYLEDGQYAGHLTAVGPRGSCIDTFAGIGKWSDNTHKVGLTTLSYLTDRSDPKTKPLQQVFLTYNSKNNTYSIKETSNIEHGAGCTFELDSVPSVVR